MRTNGADDSKCRKIGRMPPIMDPILSIAAFLTGFFPPLSVAAAYISFFLFLAAVITAHVRGRGKFIFVRTRFDVPFLFFLAVWVLASAFGMDPLKSFGKLGSQLRISFFYLFLWAGGGRYRPNALKGFLWGAGVAVAYGFLQATGGAFGLSEKFPSLFVDVSVAYNRFTLTSGRIHGSVHPLTYAEIILPFFLLGTAFFLEAKDKRSLLKGSAWLLTAEGALLLSQGRGPWLGAGIGLLVLLFHPKRFRLLLPVLFVGLSLVLHPGLRQKALTLIGGMKQISAVEPEKRANFNDVSDESTSHRLVLWNNAFQVARRNLWIGVGPGCLKEAVELHRGEKGFMPNSRGRDGDAHSQYLHHLAERGIPGLAGVLLLMLVPIIAAFRTLRHPFDGGFPPQWACWGLLAFYVAFPVINVTERVLDAVEPAMIFFFLASLLPTMKINPSDGSDKRERSEGVGNS